MAFTNAPEGSTHQVKRLPIYGGETIASNVFVGTAQTATPTYQGQRYINCYPKRIELTNTDDQWVLTKCPPIAPEQKTFTGSGTDPINCISSDGSYIWKGRRLYRNDLSPVLVYTDANDLVVKSMFTAVNPSGTDVLYAGIVKDRTTNTMHSFTFNAGTTTFTKSASISYLETSEDTPFQSVFYNGRLFAIGNDARIYNTPAGNYTSWSTVNFIVPEVRGDSVVAITLYRNYLVAFSTNSIEFFQDGAIELGSPLVRQDAYISLFGIKLAQNIAQTGDVIYFLSYEDRTGYGLYVIDNFSPKKISNFYVDTILNNEDVVGSQPFSTVLNIADFYGDPCLLFNIGFAQALYFDTGYVDDVYVFATGTNAGYPYISYSFKQRQWFDFTFSQNNAYDWSILPQKPGFMQLSPNNLNGVWKTYIVSSYGASGVVNFYSFTKDYNSIYSSVSEMVFDSTDFGVFNWKHIKSVDAVGDFGNNSVELAWTPNKDYSNWSNYVARQQSTLGYKNALRWPNLGRHRSSAFRVRFSGTSNIMFNGLEVKYNLGTV
jgi:hypothetical protein